MRKATIAALVLAASSLCAASLAVASNDPAASGKLVYVDGGAQVQKGVQTDNAVLGGIVGVGDSILTTDTGTVQWRMSDTSLFALAPESGFRINQYALPSSVNPKGLASYTLLQGAVHTLTGTIGKGVAMAAPHSTYAANTGRAGAGTLLKVAAAPARPYALKTTFALITTQDSDFIAVQTDKILKVLVSVGSLTVCTIAGCEELKKGDGAVVSCDGCKPSVVSIASLGLDSLVVSLQFKLQAPEPPQSVLQTCRTVWEHLQGRANCGGRQGDQPVSPN